MSAYVPTLSESTVRPLLPGIMRMPHSVGTFIQERSSWGVSPSPPRRASCWAMKLAACSAVMPAFICCMIMAVGAPRVSARLSSSSGQFFSLASVSTSSGIVISPPLRIFSCSEMSCSAASAVTPGILICWRIPSGGKPRARARRMRSSGMSFSLATSISSGGISVVEVSDMGCSFWRFLAPRP